MSRLFGIVAGGLVLCLLLPTIAQLAQAAVPFLVALLFVLGVLSLARPSHRRRR